MQSTQEASYHREQPIYRGTSYTWPCVSGTLVLYTLVQYCTLASLFTMYQNLDKLVNPKSVDPLLSQNVARFRVKGREYNFLILG